MEVICMEVHNIKGRSAEEENFQYFEFYNDIIFIFIHSSLLRGIFSTFFIKRHQRRRNEKYEESFLFISGTEKLSLCLSNEFQFVYFCVA